MLFSFFSVCASVFPVIQNVASKFPFFSWRIYSPSLLAGMFSCFVFRSVMHGEVDI